MFQHQIHNSIGEDIYNAYLYEHFSFGLHLHKGCEFIYVQKGKLLATVGEKKYSVNQGEWLFLPPYTVHAYDSSSENAYFAVVFSGEETESFLRSIEGKKPTENLFIPDAETADFALKILLYDQSFETEQQSVKRIEKPDFFSLKAALYALCADFSKKQSFEDIPSMENSLVFHCLTYIEKFFDSDISLKSMALELGFSHEYLSRLFHRTFRLSFKDLVNQYRCERAQNLVLSTDKALAEIAYESGFQSIRSFNRVFKEMVGVSPSELRKNSP